jgi:hypothetical protein
MILGGLTSDWKREKEDGFLSDSGNVYPDIPELRSRGEGQSIIYFT